MAEPHKIALLGLTSSEQLRTDQTGWRTFNDLEPYGLECIGAVAQAQGHHVRLFHPYQEAHITEASLIEGVSLYQPTLLAISALTNAIPRALSIAREIKSRVPGLKVILGGDHITTWPQELATAHCIDLAVIGEGEHTFRELLSRTEGDETTLESIKGIVYRTRDGKLKRTEWRDRSRDRSILPLPFLDREVMQKAHLAVPMYPPRAQQTGAGSFMLNFGCPLGCTYCTETSIGKGKIGKSGIERTLSEVDRLVTEYHVNTGMALDLTFNLYPEMSTELSIKLGDRKHPFYWYAMIRPTSPNGKPLVPEGLLEAMAYGGCRKVGIGIEAVDHKTQQEYHRYGAKGHEDAIMHVCDKEGIFSKALFIMGHPKETTEYEHIIGKRLKELLPDEVRLSFITPFPGTQIWNEHVETGNWQLLTKGWGDYTTMRPIVRSEHFTPDEQQKMRKRILHTYYSSPEFEAHRKEKVRNHPLLAESYHEFQIFLKQQGII